MIYRLLSRDSSSEKSPDPETGHQMSNRLSFVTYYLLHPSTQITILLMILFLSLLNLPMSIKQLDRSSCVAKSDAEDTFATTFTQDKAFQSLDHAYDHLWADLSLNKSTGGLIYLSKGGNKWDQGGISMFHQLHCLTMMRQALQSASEGQDIGKDWHDDGHWPHCMDYLVKNIFQGAIKDELVAEVSASPQSRHDR
ncbi:uncharacterized protein BP01DRAFT_378865 [Aspergillus saccharolyticus JOP 1030-1]|uniref:Uncharacterized protein n=1 Tax=Aspergillus saccharolyticus JOP 1030-1 TaxID=1450539 RepID=A0A318ZP29_9EURO|nr:hypothetical protein BP01DRAFT_378864 [Aspergillus saccharolyticus JOP 1030-1]XP_025435279.1 hypothetical protein BP01DRAFT_378865 [Aspergillus saccharolyticus JOP 1030-1]PYH49296.1 hypothetical protein BP01DRAFT_378864 [Aspergillus saccharolyticus JOP 1030-1]PYH49297.1 hypothetical protein BP01DRAFT_378865 [Aspergillus saccharolyticus JOP 1030-1]